MSPASKSHRREFAILAALRAAGAPVQVKHLIKAAAQLGPDAPQVEATIPRMLRSGDIELAPGQEHGTAMRFLYVQLPGTTATATAHYPDPCSKPLLTPEPEPYAVQSDLLDDPDPFARPVTPLPPTPEPDMAQQPALDQPATTKRRGRPPKNPATAAPIGPVQPGSGAGEGEGSTPTRSSPATVKAKRVDGSAIWLNAEAFAAWEAMLDDLRGTLGFEITQSQLVMYLFNRYRSADRV